MAEEEEEQADGSMEWRRIVGTKFNPTDEHLADYYLPGKVSGRNDGIFKFIKQVDVYQRQPSELSILAYDFGDGKKRMYFVSALKMKHVNGTNVDRLTKDNIGFWKITGSISYVKNKNGKKIATKTSLAYYINKTSDEPEKKSQWLMKEYRLIQDDSNEESERLALCVIYLLDTKNGNGVRGEENKKSSVSEMGEGSKSKTIAAEAGCSSLPPTESSNYQDTSGSSVAIPIQIVNSYPHMPVMGSKDTPESLVASPIPITNSHQNSAVTGSEDVSSCQNMPTPVMTYHGSNRPQNMPNQLTGSQDFSQYQNMPDSGTGYHGSDHYQNMPNQLMRFPDSSHYQNMPNSGFQGFDRYPNMPLMGFEGSTHQQSTVNQMIGVQDFNATNSVTEFQGFDHFQNMRNPGTGFQYFDHAQNITDPGTGFQGFTHSQNMTNPGTGFHGFNPSQNITNPGTRFQGFNPSQNITNPGTRFQGFTHSQNMTNPGRGFQGFTHSQNMTNPGTGFHGFNPSQNITNPGTRFQGFTHSQNMTNPGRGFQGFNPSQNMTNPVTGLEHANFDQNVPYPVFGLPSSYSAQNIPHPATVMGEGSNSRTIATEAACSSLPPTANSNHEDTLQGSDSVTGLHGAIATGSNIEIDWDAIEFI